MMHEDYGEIVSFWMGQQFTVSIASPELFKEQSKVHDRPREYSQRFFFFSYMSSSAFTSPVFH